MALLEQQKKTRMGELEYIDRLEGRIAAEIKELEKSTIAMSKEIEKYSNINDLQDSADATKEHLVEMSDKYTQGIQLLEKVKQVDDENSSEWKELQELKSKLRSQRKELLELQEVAELRKAKIEYGNIKDDCLRLVEVINEAIISAAQ